jgi:hypothetical protein
LASIGEGRIAGAVDELIRDNGAIAHQPALGYNWAHRVLLAASFRTRLEE